MKYLDENGLLYYTQKIKTWLGGKVDKVEGKGLSTNDFTTTLKNKLNGIAAGAEVNVQSDWNVTDTSSDAYIKNKPTIPEGVKLYSGTGQNTDGAMTQKAVTDAISGITQFDVQVVTSLPTTGVKGVIYLMAHSHGTGDVYDEYIWTGSAFEKIGNTDIDLSGYQTKITSSNKLSYSLLKDTPTIPSQVTESTVSGWGFTKNVGDVTNDMLNAILGNIGATTAGWINGYRSYTDSDHNKLAGIAEGAEVNVQSDWEATSGDAFIKNKPTFASITNAEIDTICS